MNFHEPLTVETTVGAVSVLTLVTVDAEGVKVIFCRSQLSHDPC